jgi:TatA/E family protein of Tat protein translocase
VFGISSTELLIIGLFAFIIFGPDKIPEIARTVSKAVAMFKKTQEDMERAIRAEVQGFDPNAENLFGSVFGAQDGAGASAVNPLGSGSEQGVVEDEEEDEE